MARPRGAAAAALVWRVCACVWLYACAPCDFAAGAPKPLKKNVLLLVVDDLRPNLNRTYGCDWMYTCVLAVRRGFGMGGDGGRWRGRGRACHPAWPGI